MAISDKNIVITPNISGTKGVDPKIVFTGADSSVGDSAAITLTASSDDSGSLTFSGSAGNLFSVTNSYKDTFFSINDISGLPSLEIDDEGRVKLARLNGKVLIGTDDTGISDSDVLMVKGNIKVTDGHMSSPFATFGFDNDLSLGTSGTTMVPFHNDSSRGINSHAGLTTGIFESDGGEINFAQTGVYFINADVTTSTTSGNARSEVELNIQRATTKDGSFSDLAPAVAKTYNRSSSKGTSTSSIARIVKVNAGNKFKIVATPSGGDTIEVDNDGCRFSAFRI